MVLIRSGALRTTCYSQAGGNAIRYSGMYHSLIGVHLFFLSKGEVTLPAAHYQRATCAACH